MKIHMGFSDVVIFGGDPYSKTDWSLICMGMFSGERVVYRIKVEFSFKNLFPTLSMNDGENNRMPEVTFDDVFESMPWDFDFNFEDLVNKLRYEEEQGITYAAAICPICERNILDDVIVMLDEDDVYFCSECSILLWMKNG